MKQIAFEMKLVPGNEIEYQRRHDQIWPELVTLLKSTGISDYSIYLNNESGSLFGLMKINNELQIEELANDPVMKKWWLYMRDIMLTHENNAPITTPLSKVFYMP